MCGWESQNTPNEQKAQAIPETVAAAFDWPRMRPRNQAASPASSSFATALAVKPHGGGNR